MKDSGKRQEFDTGARRDTQDGKGRYDLISTVFTQRLAVVMEKGAAKYGDRNWEKGMPLSRYYNSAVRHMLQAFQGQCDEDHLGQAAFNVMAFMHTLQEIDAGYLPRELDDRQQGWLDRPFGDDGPDISGCDGCEDPNCGFVACREAKQAAWNKEPAGKIVKGDWSCFEFPEGYTPTRTSIGEDEVPYPDVLAEEVAENEGMVKGLDDVFRGKTIVDSSVAPGTPPQEPICGPPVASRPTMDAVRGHRVDL